MGFTHIMKGAGRWLKKSAHDVADVPKSFWRAGKRIERTGEGLIHDVGGAVGSVGKGVESLGEQLPGVANNLLNVFQSPVFLIMLLGGGGLVAYVYMNR